MDFKQIEAFVYVVRHKSFSKAADAIYLTQPTVSAHVNSLENELGIKLIDRSTKEIYPTSAGKIFFEHAQNLINIRDNAIFALKDFAYSIEGNLEIAASTVPSQYIIPELIMAFRQNYSNITFNLVQMDTKQVTEELLDKRFEIGIVGSLIEHNRLVYEKLVDDKLVLITPNNKKYAKIGNKALTINQLSNEQFIFRETGSGTRQEFEKFLIKANINPKSINIAAQINSLEAIKQAVSIGLGVSIVSAKSVADYLRNGMLKAFEIENFPINRQFYIVHHKNRPMSPITSEFRKFALKYYDVK